MLYDRSLLIVQGLGLKKLLQKQIIGTVFGFNKNLLLL